MAIFYFKIIMILLGHKSMHAAALATTSIFAWKKATKQSMKPPAPPLLSNPQPNNAGFFFFFFKDSL